MRDRVGHIHFVGIGGVGMSGVAEVLANLKFQVSGSDLVDSAALRRLRQIGIEIFIDHSAENIVGADVVVVSTAVAVDNVEVLAAQAAKIPVVPRAEMLGELMRFRKGIAVAGTHGKTTTTAMISTVLGRAGLDPTFVVGGVVNSFDANARLGSGQWMVAEADESDASFLHLQPQMAVVTNIDADHLEAYGGDFDQLKKTFVEFLHNLPFYGVAVLCIDDPVVRELLPQIHKPILTYGVSEDADYRASDLSQDGTEMNFRVHWPRDELAFNCNLSAPGEHNVCNALAAVAVADNLDVPRAAITEGLQNFLGTGRRFESRGQVAIRSLDHSLDDDSTDGEVLLIDDYAHHPNEIAATLAAAYGAWPERRIVVVFQPHRFSRTRDLLDDFARVLEAQDPLLITEVYPAGEQPITGADGRSICRAIRARGRVNPVFVAELDELGNALAAIVRDGDVVLTLGAGDIGRASQQLGAGAVDKKHAGGQQ